MRLIGNMLLSTAVSVGVYAFFAKRRGTYDEEIGDPLKEFIAKQKANVQEMTQTVKCGPRPVAKPNNVEELRPAGGRQEPPADPSQP